MLVQTTLIHRSIKSYSPQLFWMMVSYFKETNAVSKLLWSFNHNLLLPCVQELRFVTLLQNILDLFNNTIYLSFCLRFIFRSTGFETGRRPVSFPLDNEYSNVVFGLTTHPTNLKGVIFCVPYPNLLSSTFKSLGIQMTSTR